MLTAVHYQSMQKEKGEGGDKEGEDDDDEMPNLVAGKNFEAKAEGGNKEGEDDNDEIPDLVTGKSFKSKAKGGDKEDSDKKTITITMRFPISSQARAFSQKDEVE